MNEPVNPKIKSGSYLTDEARLLRVIYGYGEMVYAEDVISGVAVALECTTALSDQWRHVVPAADSQM